MPAAGAAQDDIRGARQHAPVCQWLSDQHVADNAEQLTLYAARRAEAARGRSGQPMSTSASTG